KGSSSISSDVSSSTDHTPTKAQKNVATSEGQTPMSLLEEAERVVGDGIWTGASVQPSYLL
ncbi:hypothetical protein STEG23_018805, partial [Scotinomys teguina]